MLAEKYSRPIFWVIASNPLPFKTSAAKHENDVKYLLLREQLFKNICHFKWFYISTGEGRGLWVGIHKLEFSLTGIVKLSTFHRLLNYLSYDGNN